MKAKIIAGLCAVVLLGGAAGGVFAWQKISRLKTANDTLAYQLETANAAKNDLQKELEKYIHPVVRIDVKQLEKEIGKISELATIEYRYKEQYAFKGQLELDLNDLLKNVDLPIPIADTQYVVFAHRPLPLSPTVPTQSLILGMIAALFILSLAALVIIMPMVLRIRRIQTVCHRVTTGDYSARCHDTRRDSLGALANNVDEMTCAIERHLTQQKSLLQAVSHELRTPLARIRFAIAMIDVADDDEKGLERIESIDEDLDEIDSMLKELSFFNYVDAGKGSDHFEEVSVPEMLQATLKQRSQPLESFDVQIVGDLAGLTVTVDPTAFKRVIGNLLGNAARYAKETIVVRVQKVTIGNQLMLEVAVEDDGPGIPEDKWQEVFEPFVCLDPSRSKSVGGVGLGLAICDRIMKIHRGVIKVEHAPGGGARMVTQWPIFQV